jgi:hypothetical protein
MPICLVGEVMLAFDTLEYEYSELGILYVIHNPIHSRLNRCTATQ